MMKIVAANNKRLIKSTLPYDEEVEEHVFKDYSNDLPAGREIAFSEDVVKIVTGSNSVSKYDSKDYIETISRIELLSAARTLFPVTTCPYDFEIRDAVIEAMKELRENPPGREADDILLMSTTLKEDLALTLCLALCMVKRDLKSPLYDCKPIDYSYFDRIIA